jgi:hypothetical protein
MCILYYTPGVSTQGIYSYPLKKQHMKKTLFLLALVFGLAPWARSQDETPKQKAALLAANDFSKAKHKEKENHGVVYRSSKVVTATPVVYTDLSRYQGNHAVEDLQYQIEIRQDAGGQFLATLSRPGKPPVMLKNVQIKDAWFQATMPGEDGREETWEGAFIERGHNGVSLFGLGIKLAGPLQLTGSVSSTKLFFRKVSP